MCEGIYAQKRKSFTWFLELIKLAVAFITETIAHIEASFSVYIYNIYNINLKKEKEILPMKE